MSEFQRSILDALIASFAPLYEWKKRTGPSELLTPEEQETEAEAIGTAIGQIALSVVAVLGLPDSETTHYAVMHGLAYEAPAEYFINLTENHFTTNNSNRRPN